MGTIISKLSLRIFEFFNELLVAVGAGVAGIAVIFVNGFNSNNMIKTLFVTTITSICLIYAFQSSEQIKPNRDKIIFITGCDSGLGFSLAQHAYSMGFTVVAGCLKTDSDGAEELRNLYEQGIKLVEVDITKQETIAFALEKIKLLLIENPNYRKFL